MSHSQQLGRSRHWCLTMMLLPGGGEGGGTGQRRAPDTCPDAQLQELFPLPLRQVRAMQGHVCTENTLVELDSELNGGSW